jgi:S-adenosylhomocysteine hydrolase
VTSSAPSSFALLRSLSTTPKLPIEAERALDELRAFVASRGGIVRRSELADLDDELARLLAHNAIRHREVFDAIQNGPPIPWDGWPGMLRFLNGNLLKLMELEKTTDVAVRLSDLDQVWFATYFTRLMTMQAWNAQPGSTGKGPATTEVIISSHQELLKLKNIERQLAVETSAAKKKELLALREETSKKALLAAFTGATDPASLARAADRTQPVMRQIYEWVAANAPVDPMDAAPEISTAILKRLGLEGVYSLRVAAAKEQQADFGPLPVLQRTVAHLEQIGLLDRNTFADLVVRLRSHALPSFEQLIREMEKHGMQQYEVDASKGVSTNPLSIAGIERSAVRVDPGFGDSWRSPAGQELKLKTNMMRSLGDAKRMKKPLLVLGEGYASARALHSAAAEHPGVRIGYVAFTQSGLNFLRERSGLRFFVESLADALLKKLAESRPLGSWVVDRELELQREEKAKRPGEQTAVVIGYGDSVGPGIAAALREQGFGRVVIVDRDPARLEQAERDGFTERVPASKDGSLPPGDLYFTACGQPNVIDERALRSVPSGARVVIHGSSVESDKHFIHRARTKKIKGVSARAVEKHKEKDHRTLEIVFHDLGGKTARLRKMGQPFFDGRRDKDRMLADVYMSGLLAALAVAAKKLKGEPVPDRIETLDLELQIAIAKLIEGEYGVAMTNVIEQTRATAPKAIAGAAEAHDRP